MDPTNLAVEALPNLRTWLAIILAAVLFLYILRTQTAKIWKEERDAALEKVKRRDDENAALKGEKASVEKELAELKVKTDLSALRDQSQEFHTALMDQNQRFHLELVAALTTIASASDNRSERALHAIEEHTRKDEEFGRLVIERLDDLKRSIKGE